VAPLLAAADSPNVMYHVGAIFIGHYFYNRTDMNYCVRLDSGVVLGFAHVFTSP